MKTKNQRRLKKTLYLALKKLDTWSNKDLAAAYGISQNAYKVNKNKRVILKNIALKLLLGELEYKVNVIGWKGTHSPIKRLNLFTGVCKSYADYNKINFTSEQQAQLKKSGVCFVTAKEYDIIKSEEK